MGLARQAAQRFNHDYIGTEHILLGMVQEGSSVGTKALREMGVDLGALRKDVERRIDVGTRLVTMGRLPFTPRAKRVLELSLEEAPGPAGEAPGTPRAKRGARVAETGLSRRRVVRNRHEAQRPACRIGALGPRAVGPAGRSILGRDGIGTEEFTPPRPPESSCSTDSPTALAR